jgi:hypothetical protein
VVTSIGRGREPSYDAWSAALDRVLTVVLAVAVVAVALQTAVHLVNAAFFENPQLSVLGEGNATTWAGCVATFAAAFAARAPRGRTA